MTSKLKEGFELIGVIEHEIGKLLSEFKESKDYSVLGSHIHNWKDALKELGLTYSKAQALIDAYETFPDVEPTQFYDRLKEIGKLHKFGLVKAEQLEDVYRKAISLTIKDWTDERNILEGKESYLTCPHDTVDNYIHCKRCGKWLKV